MHIWKSLVWLINVIHKPKTIIAIYWFTNHHKRPKVFIEGFLLNTPTPPMCVASNNLYKVAACLSCSNSRVSVPGRELQPTVGCGQVCHFAHLVEVVEVFMCTFLQKSFTSRMVDAFKFLMQGMQILVINMLKACRGKSTWDYNESVI